MITPEIKDRVLIRITASGRCPQSFHLTHDALEFGVTPDELRSILNQMSDDGLISMCCVKGSIVIISEIKALAADFLSRGGYGGEELIHQACIEKLGFDIERLHLETEKLLIAMKR